MMASCRQQRPAAVRHSRVLACFTLRVSPMIVRSFSCHRRRGRSGSAAVLFLSHCLSWHQRSVPEKFRNLFLAVCGVFVLCSHKGGCSKNKECFPHQAPAASSGARGRLASPPNPHTAPDGARHRTTNRQTRSLLCATGRCGKREGKGGRGEEGGGEARCSPASPAAQNSKASFEVQNSALLIGSSCCWAPPAPLLRRRQRRRARSS